MQLALKIVLQLMAVAIALVGYRLDYVTRDGRTRRFKRGRWLLFALSIAFLLASIIFVVLDDERVREERHALELQLERAKQPLRDIYISYRVDFPMKHPALESWVATVNRALEASAAAHEMKEGLSTSQTRPDGSVKSVQIPVTSWLFPHRDRDPLPYFLLNYTGFNLDFYADGNTAIFDPKKSDLMLSSATFVDNSLPMFRDPPEASSALHVDLERGVMFVDASGWRIPPRTSRFTGRLQSIPDLLTSTMVVRYNGFASSAHEPVQKYLATLQQEIAIDFIEINIAGRHLRFKKDHFQERRGSDGKKIYVAAVSAGEDPGS